MQQEQNPGFNAPLRTDSRRYFTHFQNTRDATPEIHLWNATRTKEITVTITHSEIDGDWAIGMFREDGHWSMLFRRKL